MNALPALDAPFDDLVEAVRPVGVVAGQRMPAQQLLLTGVTVGFGTQPPSCLPREFDAVRVGLGVGVPAIRYLLDAGAGVGPCLICRQHSTVLIPVGLGTADRWMTPNAQCYHRATLNTLSRATRCPRSPCPSHIWVVPPGPGGSTTLTDAGQLHHAISLQRSPAVRGRRAPVSEARCA
ncbi:hypothetical protein [Streptomyces sp. NPDC059604]|uniref:hypothetical protein n=1 Tax=Streptomyces sp. NPDC059604 TaxID=3346881 RepID=UPI0036CB23C0